MKRSWTCSWAALSGQFGEAVKILVANLGSTSFKYRLFDMPGERLLARGGVERIGGTMSRTYAKTDRATFNWSIEGESSGEPKNR